MSEVTDRARGFGLGARLWSRCRCVGGPRLRWPRRFAAGLVGGAIVAAVAWWIAVLGGEFPMDRLDKADAASLAIYSSDGSLLRQESTGAGGRETWVSTAEISQHLVAATLASEDHRFADHRGVDWRAMLRASWLNLRAGTVVYGGSTVTMQLVRLVANTRRTVPGKLRQMVLAARLERRLSKAEILEQYLNRVYYGNGAWGAEQAARLYFEKTAGELSLGEASMLAVLPRGPQTYDPFRHRDRMLRRRSHVLGLMVERGYITAGDRELAERTPLRVVRQRPDFRAPHFVELAKERLPEFMRRGAVVRTTVDFDLQRRLERALRAHVDKLRSRDLTQASLVVLRNRDGAILALVGSYDYHDQIRNGAFNGVTARLRPGSTLKPFVYGAAMEMGDTAATMAYDVVLPEDVHQFYIRDVRRHGYARYREALAGSFNLSAVHALQRAGLDKVLDKLRTAGLETLDRPDDDYDWGLAIGHADVRLLDLTSAFSAFGRGGVPVVPRAVELAAAPDGQRWSEPVHDRDRVFSEEISYVLFDILSDPDARKPMFGDRVPMNLPFRVALKTGTTKAYTDLWAVGVTREYTVGVWAGNFDGTPTQQVMSVQGATPLMRAAYTAIAARYGDPTEPVRPETVVRAPVCAESGMAPGPHCRHQKRELFVAGTAPARQCDWHGEVCGQPHLHYPDEVQAWATSRGLVQDASCVPASAVAGDLRIVLPADGARYILEAHRPARNQRPPLHALPSGAGVRWTIDGVAASAWVPSPGRHTVSASYGDQRRDVSIVYE